jgi:hypothetical protein
MPDNELDPGASTQMFRAFVERDDAKNTSVPAETGSKRLLIVGVLLAVAAAVVIGLLVL